MKDEDFFEDPYTADEEMPLSLGWRIFEIVIIVFGILLAVAITYLMVVSAARYAS